MKNLARVLSLVLVLSMLVSSVAFAGTFTDVEAGSTYAEATSVLSDLGIILGYEDGTFGPDKVITRAEVVAVVNRLQGLSNAAKAAGGATAYTDVAADAWYAGDVNLATQMGIISGDGNGLFRPEDQVKYEEAVKMMVAACGYTQQYALSRGGWPTGYLVIATEQGITRGLAESAGAPAYRGIVAKLAYQSLTAPMMWLSSTDTDGVDRFSPNEGKILLEQRLETIKLTGYVSANTVSALDDETPTEAGKVNYTLTSEKIGQESDDFKDGVIRGILVGKTDVASTLGVPTDIYIQKNAEGKYEIIGYYVQSAKSNSVVIENTADIQAVSNDTYTGKESKWIPSEDEMYLTVYNADTDTSAKQYLLEKKVTILVNGTQVDGVFNANSYVAKYIGTVNSKKIVAESNFDQGLGLVYAPNVGKVELVDINNSGRYDTIKVTSYETVILIDDPYANNTMLATSGGTINLDFTNKDKASYTITLDGEKADIADLKKDDVLSIAMTGEDNWEIIATRATVEGQISELDVAAFIDKNNNNTFDAGEEDYAKWQFVIDGKTYSLANCVNKNDVKLKRTTQAGAEGIFYLDAFGNIALYEETSSASKNYGFIAAAGVYTSVGESDYEVRIFDKDGNTNTYVLADKVRVNGATAVEAKTVYDNYISTKAFYSRSSDGKAVAAWTFKTNAAGTDPSENYYSTAAGAVADTTGTAQDVTTVAQLVDNYKDRLITYTVNSQGKITSIYFVGSDKVKMDTTTVLDSSAPSSKYKAKLASFGNTGVAEDAIIFNLPIDASSSKDSFKVTTISSLEDDEKYTGALYNLNDDGNATALVITSDGATVGADQSLAVVVKAMTANNANGETVINLTFIQGGETKTLSTTEELATTTFAKGAAFEYSTDASGAIDKVAFNGVEGDVLEIAEVAAEGFGRTWFENEYGYTPKTQYVFGAVYAKSGRVVTLAPYTAPGAVTVDNTLIGKNIIPEDVTVTVIDCAKSNTAANKVVAGTFGDVQVTRWYTDKDGNVLVDQYSDYAVLIKYYKEAVVDVIVYKNFANKVQAPTV